MLDDNIELLDGHKIELSEEKNQFETSIIKEYIDNNGNEEKSELINFN